MLRGKHITSAWIFPECYPSTLVKSNTESKSEMQQQQLKSRHKHSILLGSGHRCIQKTPFKANAAQKQGNQDMLPTSFQCEVLVSSLHLSYRHYQREPINHFEVLKCFLGFSAFKDRIPGLHLGIGRQPENKAPGVCAHKKKNWQSPGIHQVS